MREKGVSCLDAVSTAPNPKGRAVDREAFARAWRFLGYQPVAKTAAITAAILTGILYVALLATFGLFADLVVNRGRIPAWAELSSVDRENADENWADTAPEDRSRQLLALGIDKSTAEQLGKRKLGDDVSPRERELIWRAQLHELLEHTIGPAAAALVIPEFQELPATVQRSLRGAWEARPSAQRETPSGSSNSKDPALLWREQVHTLIATDLDAAELYVSDRSSLEAVGIVGPPELNDRGILSLLVRLYQRLPDRLVAPAVAGIARAFPWTWRPGEGASPDSNYLRGLLVLALVLAAARGFSLYGMQYAAALAVVEATNRLRRAVYHHTYRLGTLAFRALGPSEAVSIFTRQIEAVHDALSTWLTVIWREPVKFALLLLFALLLSTWLSLAFLILALLVWLIGGQIAAHLRTSERLAARRGAEQLAILQESLMLMRLVKSYSMELFNQSRVERQLAAYAHTGVERRSGEAIARPFLVFLGTSAAIILLFVAGHIVLSGRLGVARGIVLATVLVSLYAPLISLIQNRKYLRRGRKAAAILFKFLDRPGEIGQVVGAEFLAPMADRLEFDNVTLREPGTGKPLLQNVSLTIQSGRKVALVGPDEMEKHAFIYLIPRLLDPDSGEIRIDNHNLRWVTFESLRAQIGMVLQHHLLFNDTVANNISCGEPTFDLPKIIEAAKIAHAHNFIQGLPRGYETPVGDLGHPLSAGERFRIALARAILRDPAILIIEEPTTVLDDNTKAMLDDTFARVLQGRTVIFLPHRISTIRSCDAVFLIHHGRIEAAGEHRELLAQSELYRHLQYLEFNVFAEELAAKGA
jgi:ATP-binding cassette subfamily B protein